MARKSGGAGDIGSRSNIRDTFYDDWIASDYYNDQANIDGNNSVLAPMGRPAGRATTTASGSR